LSFISAVIPVQLVNTVLTMCTDMWRTSQAVIRQPINQPAQPTEQHYMYYDRY